MVRVVDEVGIVGDDVKLGGAAVLPLRCMGGKVIVDDKLSSVAGLLSTGEQVCCYWEF
jgi:hypothetical protein